MVADIHRTILYGGIYLYSCWIPSPRKASFVSVRVFLMAMIIEQAGGVASTGMFQGQIRRVMELVPDDIHAVPDYHGQAADVQQGMTSTPRPVSMCRNFKN
jgi:fructose-1,6-bisphosphatase I